MQEARHYRTGGADPLYRQVKRFITEHVESGEWPADHRLPSEHDLVRVFGVSRMTVHRALRELAAEGLITRVQGVGTFVAQQKPLSALLEIRNIADEIHERGHRHGAEVHLLRVERAEPPLAAALGLPAGSQVFHSLLTHRENGVPVQLEDRYVNPATAPAYLGQNFAVTTPNEYLMQAAPLDEAEHLVEAITPDAETQRLLEIGADEPCLLVRRRTWSRGAVVSSARLVHPGGRYRLGGRFAHRAGDALRRQA